MKDLQCIQVLVPLRHLSLKLSVCGLHRCFRVGYTVSNPETTAKLFVTASDKELETLDERVGPLSYELW
jgi:hypothetical protein